jgi:hypothetical protein
LTGGLKHIVADFASAFCEIEFNAHILKIMSVGAQLFLFFILASFQLTIGQTTAAYANYGISGIIDDNFLSVRDERTTLGNTVTLQNATNTVNSPPVITSQPQNQADCYYNKVTFKTSFTSSGSVNFQWYRNEGGTWNPYGAEGSSSTSPIELEIEHAGTMGDLDGTQYRVILWDEWGTVTSNEAVLNVNKIVYKTEIINICEGNSFSLSVNTAGSIPISYQWLNNNIEISDGTFDGVTISGANSSALNISNASTAESGSYAVRIIFTVIDGVSVGKTCQRTSQLTRNVTVYPLPKAAISSTESVCLNSAEPLVTFTGSSGTPPYIFTYKINSGTEKTITTATGNSSVSVLAPTTATGEFEYALVSVEDSSPKECSNTANGSVTIKVKPLPTTSAIYHR